MVRLWALLVFFLILLCISKKGMGGVARKREEMKGKGKVRGKEKRVGGRKGERKTG